MGEVKCSACEKAVNERHLITCHFCSRAYHYLCIPQPSSVCFVCETPIHIDFTKFNSPVPITCGSKLYIAALNSKVFFSADEIIESISGHDLDEDRFKKRGFQFPVLCEEEAGLGMRVPDASFGIDDVVQYCGEEFRVDAIDVYQQIDVSMTLGEFQHYFRTKDLPGRSDKVYNVISLEFSQTKLTEVVHPPRIVTDLSWASTVWPENPDEPIIVNPRVARYCLMSARGSFTDFHIDFGGTSVWYHLLWGEKHFFLIEPTEKNVQLYEHWLKLPTRHSTFFGDLVDRCYRCVFTPGQTVFLPAGWIHAVYTPKDSLVFGGNFLHYYNAAMSVKVFELEQRVKTPDKYMYPQFQLTCFYAAKSLVDQISNDRHAKRHLSPYHIECINVFSECLDRWFRDDHNEHLRRALRASVDPINVKKLLTSLNKVLHHKKTKSHKTKSHTLHSESGAQQPNLTIRIPVVPEVDSDFNSSHLNQRPRAAPKKMSPKVPLTLTLNTTDARAADSSETSDSSFTLRLPVPSDAVDYDAKQTEDPWHDLVQSPDDQSTGANGKRKMERTGEPSLTKRIKISGDNAEAVSVSQSPNKSPQKSANEPKKPKKGMATAKQRLSKILGISNRSGRFF